jgi:hypothetical protein
MSLFATNRNLVPQTCLTGQELFVDGARRRRSLAPRIGPRPGETRSQTHDLLALVSAALSGQTAGPETAPDLGFYVRLGGIEPPTSALSGLRSPPKTPPLMGCRSAALLLRDGPGLVRWGLHAESGRAGRVGRVRERGL